MLIRYQPAGIPTVSALHVKENANLLRGKTVFLGITALSAARDRLLNPYGVNVPGVEVHAHAFETMARGDFLRRAGNLAPLGFSILFAAGAGLAFALLLRLDGLRCRGGDRSDCTRRAHFVLRQGIVFPLFGPAAVAWLASAGAATYQHFFVRRQLRRSESEKSRYQQAIHWAAHEMRTPLTAIQGSSEIMTNYSLPEAKQKQLSEMINSESKRLARLIQTFLDVERLAEGQMELKREMFEAADLVDTCMRRVEPLASASISPFARHAGRRHADRRSRIDGVRVLQSADQCRKIFAGRNRTSRYLLNAAVKSCEFPCATRELAWIRKKSRIYFKKFYRTQRAEQSGEVGTGIGLSIVEQIVTHHGGRMEVTSEPGKGSCFTMVLKSAGREEQHCRNY